MENIKTDRRTGKLYTNLSKSMKYINSLDNATLNTISKNINAFNDWGKNQNWKNSGDIMFAREEHALKLKNAIGAETDIDFHDLYILHDKHQGLENAIELDTTLNNVVNFDQLESWGTGENLYNSLINVSNSKGNNADAYSLIPGYAIPQLFDKKTWSNDDLKARNILKNQGYKSEKEISRPIKSKYEAEYGFKYDDMPKKFKEFINKEIQEAIKTNKKSVINALDGILNVDSKDDLRIYLQLNELSQTSPLSKE